MTTSNELLKICHSLVLAIEEDSKYNKEYLNEATSEQSKVTGMCLQVENIYEEMNDSLNSLLINDLNTFTIEENIGKILGLFEAIEKNKRDFFNNKLPLTDIMKKTNKITNLYNIVTGQYTSL